VKHFFKLLITCLIIFVYSGCQKEPDPLSEPPVTGDSTKLVKFTAIMTLRSATDSSFTSFEYDGQKRLTLMRTVHSTDPADNAEFYSTSYFQYNGTDTLPNIVIEESHEGSTQNFFIVNDTTYYIYDDQGRVAKDSTNHKETYSGNDPEYFYTSRVYNFTGSELILDATSNSPYSGADKYTKSFSSTETNGNITALSVDNDYQINLTYDNHPNPFYYIPALRTIFSFISDVDKEEIIYIHNTLQKNNCTGYSSTDLTAETENEVNTYTYNVNGFPATFTSQYASSSGDPSSVISKGTFEYAKW
jgi:hypothetical protein